jgi:NADP-dependent 3-hydroxy acid dehydrogenase YdfG
MSKPVCAVVGVGPGNGASFARKFAGEGYRVALLARSEEYLGELEQEIPDSKGFSFDVTDTEAAVRVFDEIRKQMGRVEVLVYNAGSGMFGSVDDATPEDFEHSWRVNALGCLACSKQVIPDMREAKAGNLVIIGATASLRGGGYFAAFASAKAAQRSLAQSMARHLGPQGIHVSYVIIDGMIDLERTRKMVPDKQDEDFLQPDHIAEAVFYLTRQPPSAWTFELDLRPFKEKW